MAIIEANKKSFLEGESPTLRSDQKQKTTIWY